MGRGLKCLFSITQFGMPDFVRNQECLVEG